jgi:aspartate/methionine/tyrosine aminotransferase
MTEDLACRILSSRPALDFMIARAETAKQGRALMEQFLERTPKVHGVLPTAGISALVEFNPHIDDQKFSETLHAEKDTVVFPGSLFECPGCIRVSYGGERDNTAEGLKRLGEMIKKWH